MELNLTRERFIECYMLDSNSESTRTDSVLPSTIQETSQGSGNVQLQLCQYRPIQESTLEPPLLVIAEVTQRNKS